MKQIMLAVALLLATVSFVPGQTPQAPAQKATIEGTVTRADNGQPLKGARVNLQPGARPQATLAAGTAIIERGLVNLVAIATVTTDANGRFSFTGVDPGSYLVAAERDGFVRSEYGQRTATGSGVAVSVSANQQLKLDLKMLQASVVSGRIVNADGEPAAQATVQAYTYRYSNGQRTLGETRSVQTNDLGEYRLYWLAPGEYFISVSENGDAGTSVGTVDVGQQARGARAGNAIRILSNAIGESNAIVQTLGGSANPPVFYPGTLNPDAAVAVTVTAASEMRGVDFHLRSMPTATVSGRVITPFPLNQGNTNAGARGRGLGTELAPLLAIANAPVQLSLSRVGGSERGLAGLLRTRLGSTPVNADGSFEIKGVAPGEYNLTATARDPNGQQVTGRTRISVGTGDVANITVTTRPGVEVRGRILLDGTPSQQFSMANLRVSLVAEDAALPNVVNLVAGGGGREAVRFLSGAQSVAEVGADGSFTLREVGAMEYRVRVTGLPQGAYVQSGRIDSNDALNAPFTIDNAGAQLQLQIGFSPGSVSGAVVDASGATASGVQAVLVPDEARRGRSDAYFTATTGQNGQFAFSNVPPGRYKLFAWEEVPAGAYQYPDFIRRYEERGQSITVNPNGAVTADARLIPAN